jgi:hypothetical protein
MGFGKLQVFAGVKGKILNPNGKGSVDIDDLVDHVYLQGTGDGQANKVIRKSYTPAASGTQDMDFSGSLTDDFGITISMTEIVGMVVFNRGSVPIKYKPHATRPLGVGSTGWFADASDEPVVQPKTAGINGVAVQLAPAGIAVANGSTDSVTFTNLSGSTAADFIVVAWGR